MAKPKLTLFERYWAKVEKTDGCWLWKAQINNRGYGIFTYHTAINRFRKSKGIYAHRLSWMFENGQIPHDHDICHRCDTPACVNPAHLFLGTAKDNMQDMSQKGRASRRGKTRLTDDQIRAIRVDTRKDHIIGADYGLKRLAIYNIQHKRSFPWLD